MSPFTQVLNLQDLKNGGRGRIRTDERTKRADLQSIKRTLYVVLLYAKDLTFTGCGLLWAFIV